MFAYLAEWSNDIRQKWIDAVHYNIVKITNKEICKVREIQRSTINQINVKQFITDNPDLSDDIIAAYLKINQYALNAIADNETEKPIYHYSYVIKGTERCDYTDILNCYSNTGERIKDIMRSYGLSASSVRTALKYQICPYKKTKYKIMYDDTKCNENTELIDINGSILYTQKDESSDTDSVSNISSDDDMQIDDAHLLEYFLPLSDNA